MDVEEHDAGPLRLDRGRAASATRRRLAHVEALELEVDAAERGEAPRRRRRRAIDGRCAAHARDRTRSLNRATIARRGAPRPGTGERYATQVGELWSGLCAHARAGSRRSRATPERLDDDDAVDSPAPPAVPPARSRASTSSASRHRRQPEPRTPSSRAALGGARDATAEVAEAVEDAGADGVDAIAARMARRALPRAPRAAAPRRPPAATVRAAAEASRRPPRPARAPGASPSRGRLGTGRLGAACRLGLLAAAVTASARGR